ncbi:hypothetical protein [Streptacidiphilus melanogenes]|uniref:hypothetical protein n=1 Tax=Streptacidiphilus melanogenes TaxID=411235 RepID=UPI0005AA1F46|nr:hypothetical protein [Streptacidiphilus melanogenes]
MHTGSRPLTRRGAASALGLTALSALLALSAAAPAPAAVPARHAVAKAPVHYAQVSHTQTCGPDSFCTVIATCPDGTLVTGGGVTPNNYISSGVYVYEAGPISDTSYRGTIRNTTRTTFQVTAKAICARIPGA